MRMHLVVPALYAALSALWFSVGDVVAARLLPQGAGVVPAWTGWSFVIVTAVILGVVIRSLGRTQNGITASLRETARKLEQSRRDYQVIIENMPDLFFRTAGDGRFQIVSHVGTDMLGYTNAEFMAMNVRDLCYTAEDRARLTDTLTRAEGKRLAIDLRLRRKDGHSIWASLHIIPRYVNGRAMSIDAIARNVTASIEATAELKMAKQAAEAATLTKSRFLAAASHDLRQPVQSLYLFAGVLDQQMKGRRAQKVVQEMTLALDALRLSLDALLDISKLDAGLVVPQFEDTPVGPLLDKLTQDYHGRAASRGLSLRVVGSRAVVRSDPILLERMLRSLLDNALRFTPFGVILVGCRHQGSQLRVDVIDTGIGIPPERQATIFEEFHQIAQAGAPEPAKGVGVGLGLAIAKRIARLLGHGLELRSAPARGSCFSISLPLVANVAATSVAAAADTPVKATHAGGKPGGATVVVIEDEPLVRLGFQTMLEGWGYRVVTAASAEEALEEIDRSGSSPDLIIADYRLPNNAVGTDAIHAIHQHCGKFAPGLIVTGDTAPQRLREAKASGFDLLHKPIAAEELRKMLNSLMAAA
jgi:PAS domain S-box-containing protein